MYKAMVVDDEPLVREYLSMNIPLFHPAWEVAAVAVDGQEAWEKLQTMRVDLLITDIKMPGMDGIELCRHLYQTEQPPVMLILSGYKDFDLAKEAILYNVNNYLLKPVVKEELITALDQIASKLDHKAQEELAFRAMQKVSKDSQAQVVNQFLKAVVSDSSVEIKALYPLVFRFKVQLIETEGIIMVLDLDEEKLAKKHLPYRDIPVFRFILHRVASEIAEEDGMGFVFLDNEQNTTVLMTGEDRSQIMHKCRTLYGKVSEALQSITGITVSGAAGTFESDVFQLQASYSKAIGYLQCRLLSQTAELHEYCDHPDVRKRLQSLGQVLSSIQTAMMDGNEIACTMALKQFVDHMGTFAVPTVLKYGINLIRRLGKGTAENKGETMELAYRRLQTICEHPSDKVTLDIVLNLFDDIVKSFLDGDGPDETAQGNEQSIVSQAKAYICAHYSEPLSLALLAEKIGVSPGYLSNVFHKTVQESYIKFLTRVRMEQAAHLLRSLPPEKVYDVAEKVGYVSVKHFSHVFKQHFDMPPGEYQAKYSSADSVG